MSKGQNLWNKAKKIIPGGNMLLSKRPEMFLPEKWPSYFASTNGCEVVDLDGNKFLDFSLMGVGTNTLGYSYPAVDSAVIQTVKNGNVYAQTNVVTCIPIKLGSKRNGAHHVSPLYGP